MNPPVEIPTHPKVEAIIADITQLMDDAERMLRDSTSQHAEEQVDLLRARCADMRSHLADFWASARQAARVGAQRTDRTIRTHPYQSLGLALGVGVLLGAVLTRSRS